MRNYEINLTYKCNWNCKYCCVDTHTKYISKHCVMNLIEKIENDSLVSLSGGEIGLLDKEYLVRVIDMLIKKNCKLSVNTNGLFLDKYPELLNNFQEILWHCSEDLKNIIYPKNFESIKSKTKLLLIIDNENLKRLPNVLKNDTIYEIIPATRSTTKTGTILNKTNYKKLLKYKKFMSKNSFTNIFNDVCGNKKVEDTYLEIIYLDETLCKKEV